MFVTIFAKKQKYRQTQNPYFFFYPGLYIPYGNACPGLLLLNSYQSSFFLWFYFISIILIKSIHLPFRGPACRQAGNEVGHLLIAFIIFNLNIVTSG